VGKLNTFLEFIFLTRPFLSTKVCPFKGAKKPGYLCIPNFTIKNKMNDQAKLFLIKKT